MPKIIDSPARALAIAAAGARQGVRHRYDLSSGLTGAQAGCALRLTRAGVLHAKGRAEAAISAILAGIERTFGAGASAASLVAGGPATTAALEGVASLWFSQTNRTEASEAAAGYWLADTFLRGVQPAETLNLTEFLLAGSKGSQPPSRRPSARRYPTGGISEKQALLIPPLMRALADEIKWCSPSIVGAKLGHTGGTRDKLAVLPGFRTYDVLGNRIWDGSDRPVRYFAAGPELCPRDAEMYRLRGETGTIADPGLMAASIMSKQIALPADVIVLDILYGVTAFLPTQAHAQKFGRLCESVGRSYGTRVIPRFRPAETLLGRAIGCSTEVLEAVALLRGDIRGDAGELELRTSVSFLRTFAEELGLNADQVTQRARGALADGSAFSAFLVLMGEHGVEEDFLRRFARDPRDALLGQLPSSAVLAGGHGRLKWKPMLLADVASHYLNAVDGSLPTSRPTAGGLELIMNDGDLATEDDVVARVHGSSAEEAARALSRAFSLGL